MDIILFENLSKSDHPALSRSHEAESHLQEISSRHERGCDMLLERVGQGAQETTAVQNNQW